MELTSQLAYWSHSLLTYRKQSAVVEVTTRDVHISPRPSYAFLKFLPLSSTVLVQFFKIFYSLFRRTERRLLSLLCLFARSKIRLLVFKADYHIPHEGVALL